MNYIVFENPGVIDLSAMISFGVSVKESKSPIGYFGTGNKYATAILCRNGIDLEVYAGLDEHKFWTKEKEIRGQNFDMVMMDDIELSYTTQLGRNWGLWQAFREIYCNCLDEGGKVYMTTKKPTPKSGVTFFVCQGHAFEDLFHKKDEIVLNLSDSIKIHEDSFCEIYDKPSKYIYYRGVRVLELQQKALFTYNIKRKMELTEDRTFQCDYTAKLSCIKSLVQVTDSSAIFRLMTAQKITTFEGGLDFSYLGFEGISPSKEFMEAAKKAFINNDESVNPSIIELYVKESKRKSRKFYEEAKLNLVQKKQLKRCMDIGKKLFPDFDRYPVEVVRTLGRSTMALADSKEMKIVISTDCFRYGTKYLMSTLIEEYAHLRTGHGDRTRELQTWLFDQICSITENHVIGEAI